MASGTESPCEGLTPVAPTGDRTAVIGSPSVSTRIEAARATGTRRNSCSIAGSRRVARAASVRTNLTSCDSGMRSVSISTSQRRSLRTWPTLSPVGISGTARTPSASTAYSWHGGNCATNANGCDMASTSTTVNPNASSSCRRRTRDRTAWQPARTARPTAVAGSRFATASSSRAAS